MATLASGQLTLADWAKRLDANGAIPIIAELLSQQNAVLEDMVFKEGNLPTGHRVVIRTGLPSVYWRSLNQGVPTSKSTTAQVDETLGMLEAYSKIDKDVAELEGNLASFRLSEDVAFLESMNQEQAKTMVYGNAAVDPKKFLGIIPRYSSLSAGNGQNIIDAGGTGTTNTSVLLVGWGEQTVFSIFPKGSKAGLVQTDNGLMTVYDSLGNPYQAYQSHYQWKNGLVVKDWRYAVRVANIDVPALVAGTGADLISLMSRALDRIPNFGMGRFAFYMNRTVFSALRLQALNKSNYVLSIDKALDQFGNAATWTHFQGIPLRRVDQMLSTESRVV